MSTEHLSALRIADALGSGARPADVDVLQLLLLAWPGCPRCQAWQWAGANCPHCVAVQSAMRRLELPPPPSLAEQPEPPHLARNRAIAAQAVVQTQLAERHPEDRDDDPPYRPGDVLPRRPDWATDRDDDPFADPSAHLHWPGLSWDGKG